jgi:DNA mismatch repair protein MutL
MTIIFLNDSIINKIAAGEVIERPASVVKEILENSFDAGADEIKIEISDAGLKKIKISDNGFGMKKEDALISFKRHATSKIKDENDLFKISSLGFRGEALASIAEVSNLRIITKTKEEDLGTFIEVEGGRMVKSEYIGCPCGTIVEIRDIFFNVPVRKNYLKSKEVELNQIIKVVMKYALIKKEILIRLIHEGKELINSQKSDSFLKNAVFVYGAEIGKNLIEMNYSENGIIIEGCISKPNFTRAEKQDQSLYVNNRYVKNNLISDSVYEAYKELLFTGRHPIFILNVLIDLREVDVNVHPAKMEIRLKNEELISKVIFNAIRNSLMKNDLIVKSSLDQQTNAISTKQYSFLKDRQSVLMKYKTSESEEKSTQNEFKKEKIGPFYVFGQINRTYIIAENPFGLIIIDQHAAEERVSYEKFKTELKDKEIKKQDLLEPKVIELNPVQYEIAINNKKFFEKIGFYFENFGERTVKLKSVPEIFGRLKSVLFIDILNELASSKVKIISNEIEERIIRFACRASVKAGKELTIVQMKKLLENLEKCENSFSCPHGRPTMINISLADFEKRFKRVGW